MTGCDEETLLSELCLGNEPRDVFMPKSGMGAVMAQALHQMTSLSNASAEPPHVVEDGPRHWTHESETEWPLPNVTKRSTKRNQT